MHQNFGKSKITGVWLDKDGEKSSKKVGRLFLLPLSFKYCHPSRRFCARDLLLAVPRKTDPSVRFGVFLTLIGEAAD